MRSNYNFELGPDVDSRLCSDFDPQKIATIIYLLRPFLESILGNQSSKLLCPSSLASVHTFKTVQRHLQCGPTPPSNGPNTRLGRSQHTVKTVPKQLQHSLKKSQLWFCSLVRKHFIDVRGRSSRNHNRKKEETKGENKRKTLYLCARMALR